MECSTCCCRNNKVKICCFVAIKNGLLQVVSQILLVVGVLQQDYRSFYSNFGAKQDLNRAGGALLIGVRLGEQPPPGYFGLLHSLRESRAVLLINIVELWRRAGVIGAVGKISAFRPQGSQFDICATFFSA